MGIDPRIQKILADFENFNGKYRREAVDAAIELKDEITPHLIAALENVRENPETYLEDSDNFLPIYALMLLGFFKENRAHQLIIDLFSLKPGWVNDLFCDMITEDLPSLLHRTCGASAEGIKALVLNRNANEYCRGSALRALGYLTIEGVITRTEFLDFLGRLFTEKEAARDSDFWCIAASCAAHFRPKELMPVIREAYEDDLVYDGYIRLQDIESTLNQTAEEAMESAKWELESKSIDDVHTRMSWWACFNPEPPSFKPWRNENEHDIQASKAQSIGKKAKKKKRKNARSARKKNRKR